MIFEEKYASCYILLTDQISSSGCAFIFSLLIYFSIYIVTSKGFSQFCNSHAYSIPLAYAGLMLYAIPSLLDIYTIDAHSIHFQFCSLIAFPSLLEQCYILMQYLFVIYSSNLVLFLV